MTSQPDWFSIALADLDDETKQASLKRAQAAVKVRLDKRFNRFLKSASTQEHNSKIDLMGAAIDDTVAQVAIEYSVDTEELKKFAADDMKAYQHKTVDPDSNIGKTPAGWGGTSLTRSRDVEDSLNGSKDHPREMQSVEQHVDDRRSINDDPDVADVIKRPVEHKDITEPYGAEQKGQGGSFGRGNQATPVTSRWHLL